MTIPIYRRPCHRRFTAAPSRFGAARRWLTLGLFALAAGNVPAETGHLDQRCAEGAEANAILAQRTVFNDAILRENPDAIAGVLAEDVLLITGTDSDVYSGRDAQLALWAEDFVNPGRLVYKRTPDCILISSSYPIALEHGEWRGEPERPNGSFFAGRYSAKWRHDGTTWKLETELYMTEDCGGAICPDPESTP